MAGTEQEEVFDSEPFKCESCQEIESCFDSLLSDLNILSQKCMLFKDQFCESKKENEELRFKIREWPKPFTMCDNLI